MRICSVEMFTDTYHKTDAGPLTRGVDNRPKKQPNTGCINCGQKGGRHRCLTYVCTVAAMAGCKHYVKVQGTEDIFKAHKKQRHSMFPFVTSPAYINRTYMGWHKKWFASYGWLRKLFKSRQIMNIECGKESVPLVVHKQQDTKSSFNNISTKCQQETCRGRKHHQKSERSNLYWVFPLSPPRERQL